MDFSSPVQPPFPGGGRDDDDDDGMDVVTEGHGNGGPGLNTPRQSNTQEDDFSTLRSKLGSVHTYLMVLIDETGTDAESNAIDATNRTLERFNIQLGQNRDVVYNRYLVEHSQHVSRLWEESYVPATMRHPMAVRPAPRSCREDLTFFREAEAMLGEMPCSQGRTLCLAEEAFGFRLRQYRGPRCIVCQRHMIRIARSRYAIFGSLKAHLILNSVSYLHDADGEYASSYLFSNLGRRDTLIGTLGPYPCTYPKRHLVRQKHVVVIQRANPRNDRDRVVRISKRGLMETNACFHHGVAPLLKPEYHKEKARGGG